MKRMPLVVTGTMVGLVGVLSLNAAPANPALGSLSGTPPSSTVPNSSPTTTIPTSPASGGLGVRSATGSSVNYYFGVLSVKVTASGSKITNVSIASISDGGNYRSQSIDQAAIPQLEQQALSVQSAKIQGVSGASYTSAGFAQSLQSALTQLRI